MFIHTLRGFPQKVVLRESRVISYSDASIRANRGGIGFVSRNANDQVYTFNARAHETKDINRLELSAIFTSIAMADPDLDTLVFTDSQTSISNIVTKMKRTKYDKLAKFVLQLSKERNGHVYVSKVKAHSGDPGNDEADRLAKQGTMSDKILVLPDEFMSVDEWFKHHEYLQVKYQKANISTR
jgi:ribonuclease HI